MSYAYSFGKQFFVKTIVEMKITELHNRHAIYSKQKSSGTFGLLPPCLPPPISIHRHPWQVSNARVTYLKRCFGFAFSWFFQRLLFVFSSKTKAVLTLFKDCFAGSTMGFARDDDNGAELVLRFFDCYFIVTFFINQEQELCANLFQK